MAGIDDGKLNATILRMGEWHAVAIDEWACEYFIFHKSIEMMGRHSFHDLRIGSRVRLTPIGDGKGGWRGIEVEIKDL